MSRKLNGNMYSPKIQLRPIPIDKMLDTNKYPKKFFC